MKEFRAESKRLLDLMINSIYTNKEIFLRELISNCSDALDKQRFAALTDSSIKQSDFGITISVDKKGRTLTIEDNGCGMTSDELEENLGTIAKSGTLEFKKEHKDDEGLIGQFGVGFYSAFMVADRITVISKASGAEKAYKWSSAGADGYEIEEAVKPETGTIIILNLKANDKDCKYDEFLESRKIEELVKKYSDYIRYPIKMNIPRPKKKADGGESEKTDTTKTLNSMVPVWKKPKKDITKEDYDEFYKSTFHDFMPPLKTINAKLEGTLSYVTLLFIPSEPPFDYHSKDYKKGLKLYSDGIMIMERCEALLPEYLGFIKGLVDSSDLSLNISREMLQQDRQLKAIAASLEKKILAEFKKMLGDESERTTYEKMFEAFGVSVKLGAYEGYGEKKDLLKDLLIFRSSHSDKMTAFSEYVSRMKEGQDVIYYASGETKEKIAKMPQCEKIISDGFEVLFLTDKVDEFVIKVIGEFDGKKFKSVADRDTVKATDEEQKEAEQTGEKSKELLEFMKNALKGKVKDVQVTAKLKSHAACVSADGELSLEMEKVLSSMPGAMPVKAAKILELNPSHPLFQKLCSLLETEKETLTEYSKVLFDTAMLAQGLEIDDAAEYAALVQKLL